MVGQEQPSGAHDTHVNERGTHLIKTHVPEPLFGSLVLGRLLGVSSAIAPAGATDKGLGSPHWRGPVALRDGIIEDPLNRQTLLLQALVEQAEMTERGSGHPHPGCLRRRRRRLGACAGHSLQLVADADRRQAVLLAHDAVCLFHVRREELVQPGLRGG